MYTQIFTLTILLNLLFRINAMDERFIKTTLVGVNYRRYQLTGKTSLHLAAERGSINDISFALKESKIDINIQDKFGNTPLHYAIANERKDATLFLINNGAKTIIPNNYGDYAERLLFKYCGQSPTNEIMNNNPLFKMSVLSAIINKKAEKLNYWQQFQQDISSMWNKQFKHNDLKDKKIKRKRSQTISYSPGKKSKPAMITKKRSQTISTKK